mgnify:CR=1 FL=1
MPQSSRTYEDWMLLVQIFLRGVIPDDHLISMKQLCEFFLGCHKSKIHRLRKAYEFPKQKRDKNFSENIQSTKKNIKTIFTDLFRKLG